MCIILAEKFERTFCFHTASKSSGINWQQMQEKDLLFVSIATSQKKLHYYNEYIIVNLRS